ncbi:MAG: hypothetical protein IPK99_13545 [Flavobacteriales bacterium]|nr:hypothetical protein [Flavobacteriales bacterium]
MKHASDILRPCLVGLGLLVLSALPVIGQTVLDGAYIKEHTKTKRVVPYTHIREADVMYARRVWRELDMREKINHPLYYPTTPISDRKSLFDVIRQALLTDGSITAYSSGLLDDDDEFKKPLLASELKEMFLRVDTQLTDDPTIRGSSFKSSRRSPAFG